LAVKVVNNTIKLNSFILTLFIFKAYLRITKILLSLLDVYKRVEAIRKVIYKIK
ncbi:hypothetical protein K469DRAFT_461033, partial [Zopfia rhizophila CBS 207.26]